MLLVPASHVQQFFLQDLLKFIHFKSFAHHISFALLESEKLYDVQKV
jgi:hypothetical protein